MASINAWMHVMVAIAISSDCILIGIVIKLVAISSDRVSMSISSNRLQSAWIVYQWMLTMFSKVGSTVGWTVGSTWLCWAIRLSKVFASSDERLSGLSAKRI
jgi:hypothetical protein